MAGNRNEDAWTADARYFEYSRAANPLGSGRVPPIPLEVFPAERHRRVGTGVIPFDLADRLAIDGGPATSPGLLASFIRIAPGDTVTTSVDATSELFHVIAGHGRSEFDAGTIHWGPGDFIVVPANTGLRHHADADADTTMYWVSDAPLLRHLGVRPIGPRFRATRFPAERVTAELDAIESAPHATDRNRLRSRRQGQTRRYSHGSDAEGSRKASRNT